MSKQPEPNRIIRLTGQGLEPEPFVCYGKFVPFEKSEGAQFYIKRLDGSFEPDLYAWQAKLCWEYADGK